MMRHTRRLFALVVVGVLAWLGASVAGFNLFGVANTGHAQKHEQAEGLAEARVVPLQRLVSAPHPHAGAALLGAVFAPPAANLDQTRNGRATAPVSPGNWVNGNAGSSTSHFVEGYSIPYRIELTDLPLGAHTVEIEWDIRHSSTNAIDYITHYNRMNVPNHMQLFGYALETLDPTIGVTGRSGFTTFAIPAPNAASPTIATTSFNNLPAAERLMTIYNGSINNLTYLSEGGLTLNTSSTRMLVNFTVTNPTAVIT